MVFLKEVADQPSDVRRRRRLIWWILTPSVLVALTFVALYLVAEPLWPVVTKYYFPEQAATFVTERLPLYIHIISGGTALLVGGVNITRAYLHRRRGHRVLGAVYTIAVAISAPAAVVVAVNSYAGTVPYGRVIGTSGFTVLAIAWLMALIVAVLAAVRGSVRTHREWITISFALTFAAVTLRVEVIALLIFGHRVFESGYPFLAWTCWIPNVLVALVILRAQRRSTIAKMPRSREGEPETDQHGATVGRSPYA